MQELYYTQSLNLASFLMAKGFSPVGKRKIERGVTIYFTKTDELHEAVREYNKNEDLKKFISAFRELKNYLNNN
ncbi:DUF5659 domain-containing protein [Bacillus sp. AG4(2022)]|uniref:DUF5659 domain-containing protein n=1 Tax=Bacillus sp. AG4(2022) TaxID=2962594 RepID=UPI002882B68B|nr:DUF5659 domain-containing protein [Bacillus sp. AG4(2022)]MDT0160245.1 DUF5659 domain-containing protein [Bacillus sp. AG4(2022)]